MTDIYSKRMTALVMAGWTFEKASLYDKEGIEGWRWMDDTGFTEDVEIGDWDEPPTMPESVIEEADRLITSNDKMSLKKGAR